VLGCALDPDDGSGSMLSGVPGSGQGGDGDDDGGDASTADDGDDGDDASASANEDASASADDEDGGGADTSDGGAVDESDGGSESGAPMDEGGDPGLACAAAGDVSMPGGGGAVPASQNCPQADFTVIVADAPGPIVDVDVSLDAIAANTSQNRVWLLAPDGTQVLLFDHRGTFLTDDFVGTEFDDESGMSVAAAPGPFHGCFQPEQALATLVGKSADGQWTLRVETCLYETSVTAWQLHLDF
jgi:hypothetical protein